MTSQLARETIFALSSGPPPAAIALIRISGPAAPDALLALSGVLPPPRRAGLAELRDPVDARLLDQALTLFFPGPRSATGEDLVELHLHGGRAVVNAVERALAALPGLRRAAPGEFTRRAFENGRLDLAEAEGLADLLSAETEGQRRNALLLADGHVSRAVRQWRDRLLDLAAGIEAQIDFSDEDDVPAEVISAVVAALESLGAEMATMLSHPPAERLRDGIRVIIGGPPNSGKSTLFNILVGREAALATPIPGTTRDLIESPVQMGGLPFLFIDTAGLRESSDMVEALGIERAEAAIAAADLLIWLGDPAECPRSDALCIRSRCDEPGRESLSGSQLLAVSAVTGQGITQLSDLIVSRGTLLLPAEGEVALARRQREALADAVAALALGGQAKDDILLLAEALRGARAALDRLLGLDAVEPLLDAIFSRFCIGK